MVRTGKEHSLVLVNPPTFADLFLKIPKAKSKQWKGLHCEVLVTLIPNENAPVLRDYHCLSVVLARGGGQPDRGSKAWMVFFKTLKVILNLYKVFYVVYVSWGAIPSVTS